MRFLPLLLANLGRRKLRTLLTAGCFGAALFLFGLLAAVRSGFRAGIDVAGADRLVVLNRVSLIQPLPIAYRDRLRRTPGVADVTWASWFGGVYQDERNFFPQFALDAESYHRVYPEYRVVEAEWRDFLADRAGAVAGAATAARFGWKVGDRIPLRGTIYPGVWEFNLRGIYMGARPNDDQTQFWFHDRYLYEKGPDWSRGIVGWYVVRVADPAAAPEVARAIDAGFANSPWESRTQTERAFAAAFLEQVGNIELLVLAIGAVVFVTLLLVAGNTMAMAVRERTGELAVLKALGYSDSFCLGLVLAESVIVAVLGGGLGLALCRRLVEADLTQGILLLYLPARAVLAGAGFSLATGLLAGALPALAAMRLQVVQALRRV